MNAYQAFDTYMKLNNDDPWCLEFAKHLNKLNYQCREALKACWRDPELAQKSSMMRVLLNEAKGDLEMVIPLDVRQASLEFRGVV